MSRKKVDEGAYRQLVGQSYDRFGEKLRQKGKCYICHQKFDKRSEVLGIDIETGKIVAEYSALKTFHVHAGHININLRP